MTTDLIDGLLDDEDQKAINDNMPDYFAHIYRWASNVASSGRLNLKEMQRVSKALHSLDTRRNYSYISSLIDPFTYDSETRIPSTIPMPTATFSVKRNIQLTTNATGNVAFAISPFFLSNTAGTTACTVNNAVGLDGVTVNNNFSCVDLGQACPANFYTRYRLVSASVRILFTSSTLNSTGFCTTSVDFDQCRSGSIPGVISQYQKYSLYSNIENGAYKQTVAVQNGSIVQINYLPIDTSFQDFYNIDNLPNGFIIAGYVTGVQTTAPTTVGRLDVVFNYEAFVNQTFADYISQSSGIFNDDLSDCRIFINNCNNSRSLHPNSMAKFAVSHSQIEKQTIPDQEFMIPRSAQNIPIATKIIESGEKLINQIVQDEVKDKDIATKLKIADMVKIPTFEDVKSKFKTDVTRALDNSVLSKIAPIATPALGLAFNIGSKILPFL